MSVADCVTLLQLPRLVLLWQSVALSKPWVGLSRSWRKPLRSSLQSRGDSSAWPQTFRDSAFETPRFRLQIRSDCCLIAFCYMFATCPGSLHSSGAPSAHQPPAP